jgi:hypothetical protein
MTIEREYYTMQTPKPSTSYSLSHFNPVYVFTILCYQMQFNIILSSLT